jgi:hypothetical protein
VAPGEFVPKSRAAVLKALEIDDTVAYAHSMLGVIAYEYDWDFDKANREYKRARELDPTRCINGTALTFRRSTEFPKRRSNSSDLPISSLFCSPAIQPTANIFS